ncbi:Cytochrome C oxidase, cbb3-type, subunit III [Jannaschia faecimaris]|uniref:Cytochrome C oxidase, cbb3-type, subunit III n=1 Tax=Jannaschia faecimaris TaxID=1244108 RepID=A0A1H3K006_9RHOB|nr:cytochrome c [Jannaschia faecimaris]SDY45471.1 Cytochrome C oxidase, cbb3-type, subunit III [Jannaschia faecimaris]
MRYSAYIAAIAVVFSVSPAVSDEPGAEVFQQYCATCHGSDARGGGPLSEYMTDAIPDLTKLSARNPKAEGQFPMLDIIHIIDGRTGLRAHGGPMPVYGAIFAEEGANRENWGQVMYTRGKIMSLVYYLESIQEE